MTDDSGQKTDDRGRLQKTSIANFGLKAVEMNLELPDKVTLIEVGPRDGFQFEKLFIPTDLKVEIISNLVDAADVIYSGLVLNTRGVARAQRAGLTHVEVSISASDTHSRKNTGMSFDRAVAQLEEMVGLAQKADLNIRAGIQCAFGCAYEGEISHTRVLNIARNYVSYGVDAIALSDTTGMADPVRVTKLIELLLPELGLANVLAALQCGITHFDTALAGMGGCPFVPGAAGNIATEDTASLMASMGILTGIDISRIIPSSLHLEEQLNKKFPGKIHRLPPGVNHRPW